MYWTVQVKMFKTKAKNQMPMTRLLRFTSRTCPFRSQAQAQQKYLPNSQFTKRKRIQLKGRTITHNWALVVSSSLSSIITPTYCLLVSLLKNQSFCRHFCYWCSRWFFDLLNWRDGWENDGVVDGKSRARMEYWR